MKENTAYFQVPGLRVCVCVCVCVCVRARARVHAKEHQRG